MTFFDWLIVTVCVVFAAGLGFGFLLGRETCRPCGDEEA